MFFFTPEMRCKNDDFELVIVSLIGLFKCNFTQDNRQHPKYRFACVVFFYKIVVHCECVYKSAQLWFLCCAVRHGQQWESSPADSNQLKDQVIKNNSISIALISWANFQRGIVKSTPNGEFFTVIVIFCSFEFCYLNGTFTILGNIVRFIGD